MCITASIIRYARYSGRRQRDYENQAAANERIRIILSGQHLSAGGSKEYNRAMQEAVEQFPQDPAAINNASAVALQEGRLGEAKALLDTNPPRVGIQTKQLGSILYAHG